MTDTTFIKNTEQYFNYEELQCRGFNRIFKAECYGKWFLLKGLKEAFAQNQLYIELLNKEFELGINLNHPNIINIVGKENNPVVGLCIVMEYVDGQTLNDFLETDPTKIEKLQVIKELLSALSYCHNLQIIHRDIKPANILVTHNGHHVKLIDFGLSDADNYASLGQPAGTAKYAAPEQKDPSATIDCRADIYSIGHLLRLLFRHQYKSIARKCLQENREKRYASANEITEALSKSSHKKIWMIVLFIILVLIALLSLSVLQLSNSKETKHFIEQTHNEIIALKAQTAQLQGNAGKCFILVGGTYKIKGGVLSVKVKRSKTKLPFKKGTPIYAITDKSKKDKSYYSVGFAIDFLGKDGNVLQAVMPQDRLNNACDSLNSFSPNQIFNISWKVDPSKLGKARNLRIRFIYNYIFIRNAAIDKLMNQIEHNYNVSEQLIYRANAGDASVLFEVQKAQDKWNTLAQESKVLDENSLTADQKSRMNKLYQRVAKIQAIIAMMNLNNY